MDDRASTTSALPWPAKVAAFSAVIAAGICVGVICGSLQASGVALVAIQSLAAGVMLGVLLVGVAATTHRVPPSWRSALLAALVAVLTQHLWLHSAAMEVRQKAIAEQPAAELFRPGWSQESFFTYMQSETTPQTASLWMLDACLLATGAVIIVEWSSRTLR